MVAHTHTESFKLIYAKLDNCERFSMLAKLILSQITLILEFLQLDFQRNVMHLIQNMKRLTLQYYSMATVH